MEAEKYFRQALRYAANSDQECGYIQFLNFMLIEQDKHKIAHHFLDSICSIMDCQKECNYGRYRILFSQNEYEKAEESYRKSIESGYLPTFGDSVSLAFVYKKIGRTKEASEIINICKKSIENLIPENKDLTGYYLAYLFMNFSSIHLMLNEKDKALIYLTEAAQHKFYIVNGLEKDPEFEKLHEDPEFKALVKRAQDEKAVIRAQVREMEESGELDL